MRPQNKIFHLTVSSAWNAVYLAVTILFLKVKPSHFLHMKLFLYSLGILQKQELEHQMFHISHLALALVFGVPAVLIDALAFLLGFMNWNLLLYIESFLQVVNTVACTWSGTQILHAEARRSTLSWQGYFRLLRDPPSSSRTSLTVLTAE